MTSFCNANFVQVHHPTRKINADIPLVLSKSESNRFLIINQLSNLNTQIPRLSTARDTQILQQLLRSDQKVLDVRDAGTAMRFLTAYCAVCRPQETILTGTSRMQERPIQVLVDALRTLGATIHYLGHEGFPPIRISDFTSQKNHISIRGDVSSQYISALLMIAPILPEGLILDLTGKISSKPYIQMTLNLMQHFGIQYFWSENTITISPQKYKKCVYAVEADWSSASYWYSMVALSHHATIYLQGLRKNSYQGDAQIARIMAEFGVQTTFTETGICLTKIKHDTPSLLYDFECDFEDCPDLAQTVAVVAAMKNIELKMTGLKSLRIKETDRIQALVTELRKYGIQVSVNRDDELHILPHQAPKQPHQAIHTYQDHRMAMAFAPTALLFDIQIENPNVVQKSYPNYWYDLINADFQITAN